jgi:hypothetical protein
MNTPLAQEGTLLNDLTPGVGIGMGVPCLIYPLF